MFKSDRSDNGVTLAISGLISRPAEKFAKSAIFCHFYLYFPAAFSRTKLGQLLFRFRMRQRSRYLFFLSFSLSLSLSLSHTHTHAHTLLVSIQFFRVYTARTHISLANCVALIQRLSIPSQYLGNDAFL